MSNELVNCLGCGRDTKSSTKLCWECQGHTKDRHYKDSKGRKDMISIKLIAGQPSTGEGDLMDYALQDDPYFEEENDK